MGEQSVGRVAIITGASRGIGAATAHAFARAGYQLALVATTAEGLQQVATELPTSTLAIAGDLADIAFTETIVPLTMERFGRVDVLVNNAAWRELGSMRHVTLDSWDRTLRICITSPAFLSRWAAAEMERHGRGVILNIGSVMSLQAAGISPAYIASKGALDALTYELASLYGPVGIRVVNVQPGAIDTELSRDVSQAAEDDEIRKFSEEMIMTGHWGKPQEVADVLVFLASDQAAYITGTTLTVDGGWSRQHLPLGMKRRHYPQDYP